MQILRKPINRNTAKARPITPTKGEVTMITLDTEPTRQQLDDRSFWDNLPPDGAEYDGFTYVPIYSILRNGEPMDFKTDDGKTLINSFPYELAIKEMQRLSKKYDNITLKITGYSQSLVRMDRRLTA